MIFLFVVFVFLLAISPHIIYDFYWVKALRKAKGPIGNQCQGVFPTPQCGYAVICKKEGFLSINGKPWCGHWKCKKNEI